AALADHPRELAAPGPDVEHDLLAAHGQGRQLRRDVLEDRLLEALAVLVREPDLLVRTQRRVGRQPAEVVERELRKPPVLDPRHRRHGRAVGASGSAVASAGHAYGAKDRTASTTCWSSS